MSVVIIMRTGWATHREEKLSQAGVAEERFVEAHLIWGLKDN